jgi:uncharacterized sulfatase
MQGFEGSLPEDMTTVAELLSEEGYKTGCISRNANASMGIDRGFDMFKWVSKSTFLSAVDNRTLIKYFANIRKHAGGFTTDTTKHATPYVVTDMAKRWISKTSDEENPIFMYLHYNEPHRPFYPPLRYLDKFTQDIEMETREAAELAVEVHENIHQIIADDCDLSEEEWQALRAMYDAEIAYTDECIGDLFDHVQSTLDGETIIILTADHGELFGEQGMMSHIKVLDDAVTRVPLVVHGLGDLEEYQDKLVQHADIMEAVVDMAGGSTEQFHGVDIREEERDYVVMQTCPDDMSWATEKNPGFDTSRYHTDMLTALRTKEFKLQKSEEGVDLFKLPDEGKDVSKQYPEVAENLEKKLDSWMEEYGQRFGESGDGELSDAMRSQLKDLGYVIE